LSSSNSLIQYQPDPALRAESLEGLDRAAFVLRAMEQVPLEEAAAILRTSSERIRDRAHRACLLLTGFLGSLVGAAQGETRWKTIA
jgi:hypothetical protein